MLSRVRAKIFGPRIQYLVCGAAPIRPDLQEFFHAIGLPIIEGYGLTETSAPATANTREDFRFGTIGKAMPGVEVKIADDGEIVVRGPGNLREYFKDPQATAAAVDADGWFHTGDLGEEDADGYFHITGRKKDIIITAGGKNIAPAPIEAKLEAHPRIGQVVLIGADAPYLVALVFPDPDYETTGGESPLAEVAQQSADAVNPTLSPYETVKALRVIDEPLTIESGLLTPTMKVKRKRIAERYAEVITEMYETSRRQAASA